MNSSLPFIESWRCGSCNELMYNTQKGYPTVGAPIGFEIKPDGGTMRVCSVCADMYCTVMENKYMTAIHQEWVQEQSNRKRLLSGQNYLDKR